MESSVSVCSRVSGSRSHLATHVTSGSGRLATGTCDVMCARCVVYVYVCVCMYVCAAVRVGARGPAVRGPRSTRFRANPPNMQTRLKHPTIPPPSSFMPSGSGPVAVQGLWCAGPVVCRVCGVSAAGGATGVACTRDTTSDLQRRALKEEIRQKLNYLGFFGTVIPS